MQPPIVSQPAVAARCAPKRLLLHVLKPRQKAGRLNPAEDLRVLKKQIDSPGLVSRH